MWWWIETHVHDEALVAIQLFVLSEDLELKVSTRVVAVCGCALHLLVRRKRVPDK